MRALHNVWRMALLALTVEELESIVDGELIGGSAEQVVGEISIDSRTLRSGQFFVPLRGESLDGHDFIRQALARGASGCLTAQWDEKIKTTIGPAVMHGKPVIRVKDTSRALWQFSWYVRRQLRVPVIGITGSTGKTSTKDLLAAILQERKSAVLPERSHNNEVGVPLTLLKATEQTEVLIVELAMRGLGEIEALARLAKPTIGLVTNVGQSHFEFLGSEQAIAEAKAELIAAIPAKGKVILNADDAWTAQLAESSRAEVLTFGISPTADYRGVVEDIDAYGRPTFRIESGTVELKVRLRFPGRHQVHNALAAAALARCLDLPWQDIKEGLEAATLSEMRMDLQTNGGGTILLNDAYNASPVSVEAALRTLADIKAGGRRIAVLGDMLELGELSEKVHVGVGALVADLGIDVLVAVGESAKIIASGAINSGMASERIFVCGDVSDAASVLQVQIEPGDACLLKASRKVGLERLAEVALCQGRG